jgi:hypothetical protein
MRALRTLLLVCALAIISPNAFAQQLLSPSEFRDAEIAKIRAAQPTAQITVRDELGITIVVPNHPDISGAQMNLDSAYRDYQNDPTQLDTILDRWTRITLDHTDQLRRRERLVSIVRSHVRVQAADQVVSAPGSTAPTHLLSRPFAGDLEEVLAFDSAESIGYVTEADLRDLGLSLDEAWSLARQNLPTRMGPLEIEAVPSPRGILVVGGGNGLAPSSLLDANFCSGPHGRDMMFVSDRNAYFIADRGAPGAFQFLRGFAQHLYQSGESESSSVLVCQSGRLVAESD